MHWALVRHCFGWQNLADLAVTGCPQMLSLLALCHLGLTQVSVAQLELNQLSLTPVSQEYVHHLMLRRHVTLQVGVLMQHPLQLQMTGLALQVKSHVMPNLGQQEWAC